jgi:predicted O-methyltransferase YrrM
VSIDYETIKALDVWRRRLPSRMWYRLRYPRDLARVLTLDAPRGADELKALYELGRQAPSGGHIVEIGSFHGSSAVALASGSRKGNRLRVYSIDPYEPFSPPGERRTYGPFDRIPLFKNLLRGGVVEDVWLINLPSQQAAKAWSYPISLLWIDGDHSYEGVKRDLESFESFVKPDGLIAFDDATEPSLGPYRVIEEAVAASRLQRVAMHGKIAVLRPASSPR